MRLPFERFDGPARAHAGGPHGAQDEAPLPSSRPGFVALSRGAGPDERLAGASDHAPQALINDMAAEDPAARERELLEELAAALASLAADHTALREAAIGEAAHAFAAAAAEILPAMARAGFAAHLALTLHRIARDRTEPGDAPSGQGPARLTLRHAPEDAARLEEAIALLPERPALTREADAGQAPGTASLTWPGGGALIDSGALAEAALTAFRDRLTSLGCSGPGRPGPE